VNVLTQRSLSASLFGALIAIGCGAPGVDTQTDVTASEDQDASLQSTDVPSDAAPVREAGDVDGRTDVSIDDAADGSTDAQPDATPTMMTAPRGTVPSERDAPDGNGTVPGGSETVWRVEGRAGEHIGFQLTFAPTTAPVIMAIDRWTGRVSPMGQTDGGAGIRVLAVFDASVSRTFWVRVRGLPSAGSATLRVTRTPFADAPTCATDCARLLQLPLPNDSARDGYATDSGTVFRYQFGRRDLLMFLRHAGQRMAALGRRPFYPYDLSQWDGETPGADTGAPRHASHQRGKDVDVSLYGIDGMANWRSFCTTQTVSGGRECVSGSARGFDGYETSRMVAGFFVSGRVTMSFLDRELIAIVAPAATRAAADSVFDAAIARLFGDGTHVQHWPNHDNHIHVRVSEAPDGASIGVGAIVDPVEPP